MMRSKGPLLVLLTALMELCWLYSWASFSLGATAPRTLSLPVLCLVFGVAALATRLSSQKGWRVAAILAVHILGIVCAAAFTARDVYYASYPLFAAAWPSAFFHGARAPLDWIVLIIVLAWAAALWAAGATFARRKRDYYGVCARFDIGLVAFFVLFLLTFAAEVKGGMHMENGLAARLIFPFFLFGLLAIGTARAEQAQKTFDEGFAGTGLVLCAASAALLAAGGAALLLMPGIEAAAKAGQGVLASTTGPLLPFMERLLRFIYANRTTLRSEPAGASKETTWLKWQAGSGHWLGVFFAKAMLWVMCALGVILLVAIALVLLSFVVRWLLTRTERRPGRTGQWTAALRGLSRFLERLIKWLGFLLTRPVRAADFYYNLCRWARRSGLPRAPAETPSEFGMRLSGRFPGLASSIGAIVGAFEKEFYGGIALPARPEASVLAWQALRSPRHWPRRIWARGAGPGALRA